MAAIEIAKAAFFTALKPPKKMTLSEWADEYFYLSAESSAEAGRWHTLPYQKGIMDAITDSAIEQISVMKSARVGYTKIMNAAIGYFIHQDPCSIMVVQPSIEDAQGYSKEEIAPMLRDVPVLRGLVSDSKTKDGDNNILQKNFPGGTLGMIGAHSGRGFRRVSRRVVIFDEVDGFPAGGAGDEGDQIKLGIKRTEYFWNRKILAGSTGLLKDHSRIERLFLAGDQRRYFVPCPQCGHFQYLKWKNMHWPEGEPQNAYFVCEENGCVIEHRDKRPMIEKGEWRGTAPFDGKHASFHIWAAYSFSPNASWGQIAKEFLESKHDPDLLKTFVNLLLGETWEEEYSAKLGAGELEQRAELYESNTAPAGVLVCTAGVDVQDNRFAITLEGYGVGEESWTISHQEIMGDPSLPEIWRQLSNLLSQPIPCEGGGVLKIKAACIDSGGHFTHEVYQFARENRLKNWVAVRGASQRGKPAIGKPTVVDINFKDKALKRGAKVYVLGVDTIKSTLFARLKHNTPGPGYIHFNADLPKDYFDQLTSEKQTTRFVKGFPVKEWVKKPGARNEALDCKVYAYAALQLHISRHNRATFWDQMAKIAANKPENVEETRNSGQISLNRPTIGSKKNFVTGY